MIMNYRKYWDSESRCWRVYCDHFFKDKATDLFFGIENNRATIFYNQCFPHEIPQTVIVDKEGYENDSFITPAGEYDVSAIVVKCEEWHITLPETIETVVIDRDCLDSDGNQVYYKQGTSENSTISVSEDNKKFKSVNGSLYSKDGKILYHYHSSEESELLEELEEIRPGAIYKPGSRCNLVIPPKCKNIAKDAICGEFSTIDFTGGLNIIERGALEEIKCKELRIKGLLSDINYEGQQELNELYHKTILTHRACPRICFMAPMPTGGKAFENGYIELSQVLSSEQKLNGFVDTRPISINSYINERFNSARVPIVIEEIELSEKTWELYDASPNASRICFVDRENREHAVDIYVHEKRERVLELIDESFRIARSK